MIYDIRWPQNESIIKVSMDEYRKIRKILPVINTKYEYNHINWVLVIQMIFCILYIYAYNTLLFFPRKVIFLVLKILNMSYVYVFRLYKWVYGMYLHDTLIRIYTTTHKHKTYAANTFLAFGGNDNPHFLRRLLNHYL